MKTIPVTVPSTVAAVDYSAGVHFFADLLARAIIVVLFTMMAVRFATDFFETGRITGLFLLLSEAIVVVLTLVQGVATLAVAITAQ